MWDILAAPIIASVVTGGIYYMQEILLPSVNENRYFETVCDQKGGIVFYSNETGRLCLDKKSIINI